VYWDPDEPTSEIFRLSTPLTREHAKQREEQQQREAQRRRRAAAVSRSARYVGGVAVAIIVAVLSGLIGHWL
jgi:hypothetical protein